MISLYAEKENEQATLDLYDTLGKINLDEQVGLTINNLHGAESGILREGDKVVDISLAHCYSLEDVVRELVRLVAENE